MNQTGERPGGGPHLSPEWAETWGSVDILGTLSHTPQAAPARHPESTGRAPGTSREVAAGHPARQRATRGGTPQADSPGGQPPSRLARRVVALITAAAGMLAVAGFAASFAKVSAAARPTFGQLAPMVSLSVDLAVLVFAALGLLLAYLGMPARWLRLVPWGLTAVMVTLNISGESTLFGVVGHAALPCLWLLAVAVAEHVVRDRLALTTGARMDTIRLSRWLLAPASTLALWRRSVLWECRRYSEALARERRRLYVRAALRDSYGLLWRFRAPRRLRVAQRLGELDPAEVHVQDRQDEQPDDTDQRPPDDTSDALLAAGLAVRADLAARGADLTRSSLVEGLRARDVRISTDRATALLRALRTAGPAPDLSEGETAR